MKGMGQAGIEDWQWGSGLGEGQKHQSTCLEQTVEVKSPEAACCWKGHAWQQWVISTVFSFSFLGNSLLFFLSKLCAQGRAQTQGPDIKSRVPNRLSQPGTPAPEKFSHRKILGSNCPVSEKTRLCPSLSRHRIQHLLPRCAEANRLGFHPLLPVPWVLTLFAPQGPDSFENIPSLCIGLAVTTESFLQLLSVLKFPT